jgi:hypothetical protein
MVEGVRSGKNVFKIKIYGFDILLLIIDSASFGVVESTGRFSEMTARSTLVQCSKTLLTKHLVGSPTLNCVRVSPTLTGLS